jgi:flagellar biogenesis protein FliO
MRVMRLAVVAAFVPSVAVAAPEITLEMIDRGDAVEVIAHNVKATHTTVNPVRSRLEVPLAGYPMAKPAAPTDTTVKVIELDGGEVRSLSVKLNYERNDVRTLSRFAQVIQVGDDVHLIFPRKLPVEGEAVKLPEPTLPPALAATLAKPEPKPAAKPEPKKPEPAAAAKIEPPPAPKPDPVPTKKAAQIPTVTDDDASSKLAMYAALGLAAIGGGLWIMKKRKTAQVQTASIDVVAQRSLGGKTKIVWLTAGAREMLVAVTPQNVRMLGQWDKGDAPPADEPAFAPPAMPRTVTSRMSTQMPAVTSPAVDGILKLRRQTGAFTVPAVNDEVATDDVEADAAWAREMFVATGRR